MPTVTLTEQLSGNGDTVSQIQTFTHDNTQVFEVAVGVGATDLEITISIVVARLRQLWVQADQALTLETNSASSPTQTISLQANKPLHWETGGYFTNPLSADVNKIFATNGSGVATTLKIRVLMDPTP